MDKVDVVIAGGGVIGLAIAEALSKQYHHPQ
jgi:L-2-hydroxyglutarate oxidase LhgO